MPANDTAALVVALSAQLTRFEKDMDAALGVADKGVKRIEQRFAQSNNVISKEMSAVAQNAAGSLGTVGRIIASIGPFGFAAAVGLGGLALAFDAAASKVDAFAEKAKRIKDAAEVSGVTILQFRLLAQAGNKVGLDFESTESFVERLTLGIDQLKRGGGELFDQLVRIDSGLIRDVASARTNAEAIDVLARAYRSLGDQNQRNALAGAIGGRRNVAAGRLLDAVGEQGGLKALEQQADEASRALSDTVIPRVDELRRQLEEVRKRTDGIWGAAFATDVLEAQLTTARNWQAIADAVSKVYNYSKTGFSLGSLISRVGEAANNAQSGGPFSLSQIRARVGSFPPGAAAGEGPSGITTGPQQEGARGTPSVSASVELELMRRYTSLLGEAITPAEQLKLKILELSAAQEKGGVSDQQRARALDAFKLSQQQAAVSIRERLGIATQEEIVSVRLRELEQSRARGYVRSAEEMAAAERLIAREARLSAEALAVRNAALPGLKQFELDAQNLQNNLDSLATTSLSNLSSALVDFATGTLTAGEAFRQFGLQVSRSIIEMVTRMLILAPIAQGLQSILGGATGSGLGLGSFFGLPGRASGGPVEAGVPYLVGEHGPEPFIPRTAGTILPNEVLRQGGASGNINLTLRMDLTGANGDDTIRRIAAEAGRRAVQQAVAITNQAAPARQLRFAQLGT